MKDFLIKKEFCLSATQFIFYLLFVISLFICFAISAYCKSDTWPNVYFTARFQ